MKDQVDAFHDLQILTTNTDVPGDYTYFPFGRKMRELYVKRITDLLIAQGYEEWHFNDIISSGGLQTMNTKIMDISKKVYPISGVSSNNSSGGNYALSPTHEIPIMQTLSQVLKLESQLPMHFFHVGPSFRRQASAPFPFNLSTRKTYIESYGVYNEHEEMEANVGSIIEINHKVLTELLQLPYIASNRPLITNNPISERTIGYDVMTKLGRTLHAGMIYFQNTIFTKAFDVKVSGGKEEKKHNPHALHFGFTDNLLLATALHALEDHKDFKRLILPDSILPNQVVYNGPQSRAVSSTLEKRFAEKDIRMKILPYFKTFTSPEKQQFKLINGQGPYIHIKDISAEGVFRYRMPPDKHRHEGSFDEVCIMLQQLRHERNDYLYKKSADILNDRIVETSVFADIISLINQGKVVKVRLSNDDSVIRLVEDLLHGGEILGFEDTDKLYECIYSGRETSFTAYISKRI